MEKKNIRILSTGLITFFFINLLLSSLFAGGRWDLNEHIAFADRLANGVSGYSNGIDDLFYPSTPYFPGIGYLSYFLRLVGIESMQYNNYLLLLIAVLTGVLYFVLLQKITLKLYPGISKTVVNVVLAILFATHFKVYMIYMGEFKPDTILLVIAALSFFVLDGHKKPSLMNLACIGFLLFSATFFKQSFFLVSGFVFLLVFLNRFFSVKEKVLTIGVYGIIGLVALWLIFMIPNAYYFSVEVMGKHAMLEKNMMIGYFLTGIKSSIIFLALFCLFLVRKFRDFSIAKPESKYFLFAMLWCVFSIIATTKKGGNSGNFEVGIIVFIPFVIYIVDSLLNRFYEKKWFVGIVCGILALGTLFQIYLGIGNFRNFVEKRAQDKEVAAFLADNFKGKKVFIDGTTYINAETAGLDVITEAETAGHFNNIPAYDFGRLKEAVKQKQYDLFLLDTEAKESFTFFSDADIWQTIDKNYIVYENDAMPKCLKGKILVPKKDK